ncbi:NYN domain-containing protein [Mycolicibacterium xanthum]|uniref:NYN domain-containing protein n=1 Tax=Mycolicibacterium xanthum TaxID=2796469 RepID=UPI0027E07835|nr:NYN domain-containing protein [Mycolicibacterium xanthum]
MDAGYLLAAAATRVTGTSLRNGIHVEFRPMIEALIEQAQQISGLPVLRLHWYDSAKNGVPDKQQERIGELPRVKLRLGRFGVDGQQKGVDLRIGLDLVAHARSGTADVFFLVSGDDDLTEAVEEAQAQGVQVVVLAVPNPDGKPHAVSRHLLRAADELRTVCPSTIDDNVMKVETPQPVPSVPVAPASPKAGSIVPSPGDLAARRPTATSARPAPVRESQSVPVYSSSTGSRSFDVAFLPDEPDDEQIDQVVANVIDSFRNSADAEAKNALSDGRPSIPPDIDKALLLDLSDAVGSYELSDLVRVRLRSRFWQKYDELSK